MYNFLSNDKTQDESIILFEMIQYIFVIPCVCALSAFFSNN